MEREGLCARALPCKLFPFTGVLENMNQDNIGSDTQ